MPSGIIQPRLPGFLDLLQLKNNGRQPPLLSDEVGLQIDVSQWYAFDRQQPLSKSYTALAGYYERRVELFTVPQNEVYLLFAAEARITFNTTTATALKWSRFVPTVKFPFTSGPRVDLCETIQFDSSIYAAWPNGDSAVEGASVKFNRPCLLPGGSTLGFNFTGELTDATNNGTIYGNYSVVPLAL